MRDNNEIESFTFEHAGQPFVARVFCDMDIGPPWKESDGHGPVSDWTSRDKRPGELVLATDQRSRRFYDFAGAVRLALRDNWGTLPAPLKVEPLPGDWKPYQRRGGTASSGPYSAFDSEDVNRAIHAVYAAHRASMTKREYAAAAAMADFSYIKAWCDNEWTYVGIVVQREGACTCCGRKESLWGIESNSGDDYYREIANELASQFGEEE